MSVEGQSCVIFGLISVFWRRKTGKNKFKLIIFPRIELSNDKALIGASNLKGVLVRQVLS